MRSLEKQIAKIARVSAKKIALDEERPFEFADPDAAERGFKVTLAPRSFNTFVLD